MNIREIFKSVFLTRTNGMPRWLYLFRRLFIERKLPGTIDGILLYLRYVGNHLFGRNPRKSVYICLGRPLGDRYLFQLIYFLILADYDVFFLTTKPAAQFIRWEYARYLYREARFHICCSAEHRVSDAIFIYNDPLETIKDHNWARTVFLNPNIDAARNTNPDAKILPYPFHPVIYRYREHERLSQYRAVARRIGIFFSGMYTDGYDENILREQFHKLPRPAIVRFLKTYARARIVCHKNDFQQMLKTSALNQFLVIETQQMNILQRAWMTTLSYANFFLAAPGDRRPICHNIIECMAVGTIPITNYPEWFFPPLQDGVNALLFQTEDELADQIERALAMDTSQIQKMREAVIQYYDRFLSPRKFMKNFFADEKSGRELFISTGDAEILSRINENSIAIRGNV